MNGRAPARWSDRSALPGHLARGGRFVAIPVAAILGAGLLVAASRFASWGAGSATSTLRTVGVALAVGVVFSLDDAAGETLAASPTSLVRRRGVIVALALTGVAGAWGLLVGLGDALLPAAESACLAIVDGRLSLELGALATGAIAIGTVAARSHPTAAGITAGPGIVLAFVAAEQVGGRWTLFARGPLDAAWAGARGRLWLVLVLSALVALWSSRDPWRRPWRRSARPRRVTAMLAVLVATGAAAGLATAAGSDDVSTTARLEAALHEVVAAQGIERLQVRVSGVDGTWSRSVVDGQLRPAGREEELEVGRLDVAEVGRVVDGAGGVVAGTATPTELEAWVRALPRPSDDELARRVGASAPPGAGTRWVPPRPGHPAPRADAVSEVRHLAGSDTVVVVMSGPAVPACGLAAADVLAAHLR